MKNCWTRIVAGISCMPGDYLYFPRTKEYFKVMRRCGGGVIYILPVTKKDLRKVAYR